MSSTLLQIGGWSLVALMLGLGTKFGRGILAMVLTLAVLAACLYGLVAFVHMAWRLT